jgi:hypothetical protein
VDLGKQSLAAIEEALADVRTVFWNGPVGVFEIPSFAHGTNAIARFLGARAEAGTTVVVGGGDSVAALQQQGLASKMTHISTGGGASLEFLEGRELPGVAVLLDREPERAVVAPRAAPKTKSKAEPQKAKTKAEASKPRVKAETSKAKASATKAKVDASKPKALADAPKPKPKVEASKSKPKAKAGSRS